MNKEAAIIRTTYIGDKKDEGEAIAKAIHQLTLKATNTIKELNKDVLKIIISLIFYLFSYRMN